MPEHQLATPQQERSEDRPAPERDASSRSAAGMGDQTSPVIAQAEELLGKINDGDFVRLWDVEGALKGLASSKVPAAAGVAQRLRAAAKQAGLFDTLEIRWAQEYVDAHKAGTESNYSANMETAVKHLVKVGAVLRVSQDPVHERLHADLDSLSSFYGVDAFTDYNQDLIALAHRMRAFLDAGQQIGPQAWGQAGVQMDDLDGRVMRRYAGKPAVEGCKTFKTLKEAYDVWVGVRGELEAGQYENLSAGDSKSQLDASASDATVPEYENEDFNRRRRDCELALGYARDTLDRIRTNSWPTLPAQCQEAILRLRQMLPHMQYSERLEGRELVQNLRTLYETLADPKGEGPTASSGVSLDITKPFGVTALTGALNTIADQPGEKGVLSFHGELGARVGTGFLSGEVQGLIDLSIGYTISDTATCTLFFDAAATVKAGISLAGIASVGVQAGVGYNIAARFPNPDAAGSWLYAQLAAINDRAGGRLLGASSPTRAPDDPVVVEETRGKLGAQAEAGLAGAELRGEVTGTAASAGFSRGGSPLRGEDGQPMERSSSQRRATIGASYRSPAGWGMDAAYTYTANSIRGDANSGNDGDYKNHNVDIGFSLGRIINSTKPVSEALPSKSVQDGILNLFAQFESSLPGGGVSQTVLHGVFDRVVGEIYSAARTGRENRMNARVSIGLTWQSVRESTGEYQNQYFRVSVNPSFSRTLEISGGVVSGEAEVGVSGSVVVLEDLGSDTLTYVQQRREFRWSEAQWRELVNTDRAAFEQIIKNLLDPDHHLHSDHGGFARFATAHGYPEGGFDAGLRALEQYLDQLPRLNRA